MPSSDPRAPAGRPGPEAALALVAAAALALFLVYVAAGPLFTDDLWFHLRMGRHFASEGLFSGWDPILHTANRGNPVTHEWLFGIAVAAIDRLGGFPALRVVHGLAVAGIAWLSFSLLRRQAASTAAAACALAVFLAVSWWRLAQLRPDLVTVPATFAVYALLLDREEPPGWGRVAAVVGLLVVWVNAHSGFVLGPLVILAGAAGRAARAGAVVRWLGDREAAGRKLAVARRLGAALALGLPATLLNPRGWAQHLTFLHMREGSVLAAQDDWAGFHPLRFVDHHGALGPWEWALTDALFAVFLVVAGVAVLRFLRCPSRESLEAADPVRGALGMGSLLAIGVAMRFDWMVLFALLFVLRAERLGARAAALRSRAAAGVAAGLAVLVAAGFFAFARYRQFAELDPRVWWLETLAPAKYGQVAEGLRFLAHTGVQGNLFNSYSMGAFFGYWLAPRVRSFIDGRNEAYPPDVFRDYAAITLQRGAERGETFLDVLDRRHVDLFFGTGHPFGQERGGVRPFTTSHVEGVPGWLPVFRSVGEAVYLRSDERNRENLERIAAYYARQRVPFDRERGFDVDTVIRERPDWAEAHQILPIGFDHMREATASGPPVRRVAALEQVALYLALAGAWEHEVDVERALLERVPQAVAARRRLVHALLRLGRTDEALAEARELARRAPRDPVSARFVAAARTLSRRRGDGAAAALVLAGLPLVDRSTAAVLLTGRYRPAHLDEASLRAAVAAGAAAAGGRAG